MKICILLTCVGGLVAPGVIDSLRQLREVSRIIGTDLFEGAIGFHMADKGYVVPKGDSTEYIHVISDIIEREAVDVVIPFSDEEVVTLSRYKESFEAKGVAILCSPYEITSIAIDKGSMLTFLQEQGVPVPRFCLPRKTAELAEAAKELGYPSKPVVVKPRLGRGGRGFKILQEEVDVLSSRDSQVMKLEWYVDAVQQHEPLEVILMEYLPGDDYSVDVLADNGRPLFIVPRRRIKSILGPSQVGEVFWNQEIVDLVKLVVKIFGFNSNVNIQLKYSGRPNIAPNVYEINPRVSGTIVAGTAAGIDLLYYGIKHALGFELRTGIFPRPVKMIRYLREYFVTIKDNQ
jgi:carbamoyl-phosphate synthase large subunit